MNTLTQARDEADLVFDYDGLGTILESADDNRGDAVDLIIDGLTHAFESDLIKTGNDLDELKKKAALIAIQYYVDGVRQSRERVVAQLLLAGVTLDVAGPDDCGSSVEPTTIDHPVDGDDASTQAAE